MADSDKPIRWVGSSKEDLSAFPSEAKAVAGYQLRRVQKELAPNDFKPMKTVGKGVSEIIINSGDAFRVFYIAKFEEGVYVLHAFQKTTRKTSRRDIIIGQRRYREVLAERKKA